MSSKLKSNKTLYIFLAKAAGLFIGWQAIYYLWINQHTNLEMWLTGKTAAVATTFLNWFGYHTIYINHPGELGSQSYSQIFLNGFPLLGIADSCNALTLIILFIGFIIAYPGNWWYRLLFIGLGSLFIFGINIIRSLVLIFNYMHFRSTFEFNHKYTFTILVYLVVFAFWMYWAFVWSKKKPNLAFK